jgi:hypothetical protein
MIALRVEDAYGAAVVILPMAHERAAVVYVEHADRMPDLYLDAVELRDLARIAAMAADELDRLADDELDVVAALDRMPDVTS